ncbi:PQQ-binding-like beta-propeller repeat protein [Roseivirga sp. BDSF3-8]|uniref:outer membrane protein assembly factor BamB family protein n=1 Tax=Roseivirga sp. BDSF3-8 TaxID=3241598 RepID=UPI0035323DBC
MFKLIDKYDNVLRYFLNENNLFFTSEKMDNGGEIKKMDLSNGNLIASKSTGSALFTFTKNANGFLAKDISGNGLLFSYLLDKPIEIPSPTKVGENHVLTDFISVYQGRIKNREFGIYSISSNDVLWMSSQLKALEVFGDKIFGQSEFVIYRTAPDTGRLLWKSDLKTKYRELIGIRGGVRILGLCENLVIAAIENIDKLIALDLATGVLKWDRTTLAGFYKLDIIKSKLHIITGAYKCLDPISGNALDSFDDQQYFKEVGIFSQRNNYAIDGDHLITTDYQKGIIGALNTATHKFDWLHEEEGVSFPTPSPVVYQAPYLLVHDNRGTLHIFQKE